jgi:hypothetical protein
MEVIVYAELTDFSDQLKLHVAPIGVQELYEHLDLTYDLLDKNDKRIRRDHKNNKILFVV